jgi:hypothetical protein
MHRSTPILALLAACALSALAPAQTQIQDDSRLAALAGAWSGSLRSGTETLACTATFAFTLQGAYLEGRLAMYEDASKRTAIAEELFLYRVSDEGRMSLSVFDSRSLSKWGSIDVSGTTWAFSLQRSDGSAEKGALEWLGMDDIAMESKVLSKDGAALKTVTLRLRREPAH